MKSKILHKGDYSRKFDQYVGFGQYEKCPLPLCDKKYSPYNPKKIYYVVRNKSKVTCKKCLRILEKQAKEANKIKPATLLNYF